MKIKYNTNVTKLEKITKDNLYNYAGVVFQKEKGYAYILVAYPGFTIDGTFVEPNLYNLESGTRWSDSFKEILELINDPETKRYRLEEITLTPFTNAKRGTARGAAAAR